MRYALSLLCVLSASPALAQQVDANGAEALTASLARYIGAAAFEKSVVKVTADGDAYRLDIDFDQLLSLFPVENTMTAAIDPYVLRIKPRADGTWDVAGDLAPNGKLEMKAEGGIQKTEWTVADDNFSGVYDPGLAGFSIASGKSGAISVTSSDPSASSETKIESSSFDLTSTKNANEGADFAAQQTLTGFLQTMRVSSAASGMDFPVVIRSPEVTYKSGGSGLRSQALLDLLAFAVSNADEADLKAAQPELKALLRNALPLWDQLDGAYGWRELSVGTPVGIFGAANARLEVAMDGISKDGTLSYGFVIDDLTVPADVAPAWTAPLLPKDFHLNFAGTGLDLEGPLTTAIDAFDLNRDPPLPDEVGNMIAAQFLANPPKFVVNRSIVRNKDTEISAEGEMTFAGGKPAFTATVEATGFDKAMQTIQEATATAPEAQQAYMVAVAAKGFAKTLSDGRLQWVVNMTPDGAVTVNAAMVKPPNPPAEPSAQ